MSESELSVDRALKDAEYGIVTLEKETEQFDFYFRGTLAALKGTRDYVLYEYNDKFGLQINEDYLNEEGFRETAGAKSNEQAKEFIKSYSKLWSEALKDCRVKFMIGYGGVRDRTIHRGIVERETKVNANMGMGLSPDIIAADAKGNITNDSEHESNAISKPTTGGHYLKDWPNDDIITLCKVSIDAVRNFVKELRSQYPQQSQSSTVR